MIFELNQVVEKQIMKEKIERKQRKTHAKAIIQFPIEDGDVHAWEAAVDLGNGTRHREQGREPY